jgi:hypothetical protein
VPLKADSYSATVDFAAGTVQHVARQFLGKLVSRHGGNASLEGVFPGYAPQFLGLV